MQVEQDSSGAGTGAAPRCECGADLSALVRNAKDEEMLRCIAIARDLLGCDWNYIERTIRETSR